MYKSQEGVYHRNITEKLTLADLLAFFIIIHNNAARDTPPSTYFYFQFDLVSLHEEHS